MDQQLQVAALPLTCLKRAQVSLLSEQRTYLKGKGERVEKIKAYYTLLDIDPNLKKSCNIYMIKEN